MNLFKKNIPFFLLLLVTIFCCFHKETILTESIISAPDSNISFSTNDILKQTWSPHAKKVSGISIPYTATTDFSAEYQLTIYHTSADNSPVPFVSSKTGLLHFLADESGMLTFDFKPIQVNLGERYIFEYRCIESSSNGTLNLPSSSNYSGCSVNQTEINEGLDMKIQFHKYNRIFLLFSVFMPLFSFSLLFMLVFKRPFEETVGVSLISMVAILYISGLFGFLETGIAIIALSATFCMLFSIYLYNKSKTPFHVLLSPGLIVFCLLSVIIILFNADMQRAHWDEFSHWGLAVKDMFYFDSFGNHAVSTVMLPNYPPFITLFQYYLQYFNGMFAENLLYIAYQIAILCLLLTSLREVSWKKIILLPCGLVIILFVPLLFFPEVYNSIYADPLLAYILCYLLLCYYTDSEMTGFKFLRLSLGLFALTLTKETGFVIAGMLTIHFLCDFIYRHRKLFTKKILPLCAFPILTVFYFISWRLFHSNFIVFKHPLLTAIISLGVFIVILLIYRNLNIIKNFITTKYFPLIAAAISLPFILLAFTHIKSGNAVAFAPATASGITLQNMLDLITGNAPMYRYHTIKTFVTYMFSTNVYSLGILSISIFDVCFILLLLTLILTQKSTLYKNDTTLFSLTTIGIFCFLPYLAFLLICYLFVFPEREAIILHSCQRYAASYIGGLTLTYILYLFIAACKAYKRIHETNQCLSSSAAVCLGLTLSLFIITPVEHIYTQELETKEEYLYGTDECQQVLRSFADKSEKVYIVCNNTSGFSYYVFRNAAVPLRTQEYSWNIFTDKNTYLNFSEKYQETYDSNITYLSLKEWASVLQADYDYVFLLHPCETFSDMYGSLFEAPETISDGSFYKIVKEENEQISLQHVGQIGIKKYS